MKWIEYVVGLAFVFGAWGCSFEKKSIVGEAEKVALDEALADDWAEALFDPGTEDWRELWFLDGAVGTVSNSSEGMTLSAGPEARNDAHHMVLWTKQRFEGDVKIEYDYTRLDNETKWVNILYVQATGSGEAPYAEDIAEWNELREVPAMRMYFDHMNTFHISYAAFPNNEETTQYLRGRRYMPNATGLRGSNLKPDYLPVGLFEQGVPHHITVIKRGAELLMRIQNADQDYYCRMSNEDLPPITEGRVGLRHMYTRSSVYKNFRISVLD